MEGWGVALNMKFRTIERLLHSIGYPLLVARNHPRSPLPLGCAGQTYNAASKPNSTVNSQRPPHSPHALLAPPPAKRSHTCHVAARTRFRYSERAEAAPHEHVFEVFVLGGGGGGGGLKKKKDPTNIKRDRATFNMTKALRSVTLRCLSPKRHRALMAIAGPLVSAAFTGASGGVRRMCV